MELYKKLNISDFLYEDIICRLKRKPNDFETYLFSAMHSEHCGYMHSKNYIKDFYNKNNHKDENAGSIKIKDHHLFFKIESHNHPCAIEPYQGSMTGIGGIVRDILALNARPIALMNSIKFENTGYHFQGVVKGISDYGNSIGAATISGETIFDEAFKDLPIVNVFAAGIVKKDKIKLSKAKKDCLIVLLGSKTGVDGLNGANFASNPLDENSNRQSVQIGDPYTKNKLIEATLKINSSKNTIACQDLGASGILSSTSEMAYKGNVGIELYLEKVHTQIPNIKPSEIMLSESQERMAFAIKNTPKAIEEIEKIAREYELEYSIIGKTTNDKHYKVFYNNELLGDIELEILCNPYGYILKEGKQNKKPENKNLDLKRQFENLIQNKNFSSKAFIYEQFDQNVKARTCFSQNDNMIGIQYLKETNSFVGYIIHSALGDTAKNNVKNTFLHCYRSLVSCGIEPKGLTNCLNFSNPNYIEVQNDFLETIETLKNLSFEYKLPVVSGNVSFYNETKENKLKPVTTLAFVGCANKKNIIPFALKKDYEIYLLNPNDQTNFKIENEMKKYIFKNKYITCPIGSLGLIGTLIKKSLFYNLGFEINLENKEFYFKPYLNSYLIFIPKGQTPEKSKIPLCYIGKLVDDKIKFDNLSYDIEDIKKHYQKFGN